MTIWLLSIAAFCSCTDADDPDYKDEADKTVIISGSVSDISSEQPVEGAKIAFTAYGEMGSSSEPLASINTYTDSRGTFKMKAEHIGKAVTCILVTEHPHYSSIEKEIIINWSGTSYDPERRIFYVNDCDFHIEKNK